jgi:hypothetical protein
MATVTAAERDAGKAESAPEADPADAAKRPAPHDEAARARAYLDLWERNLVHAALHLRTHPRARTPQRRARGR